MFLAVVTDIIPMYFSISVAAFTGNAYFMVSLPLFCINLIFFMAT